MGRFRIRRGAAGGFIAAAILGAAWMPASGVQGSEARSETEPGEGASTSPPRLRKVETDGPSSRGEDAPSREGAEGNGRWSVAFGVAMITRNNIEEVAAGRVAPARGRSRGLLYNLSLSYRLHTFQWEVGSTTFTPQLELPVTLTVVDQAETSPFLDYNAAIALRWVDFPWSSVVHTTFLTGLGLAYSEKVFRVDRERHPDRSRSHLKFHWPLEVTLAHPELKQHQLLLFNDHHSGGHVFDRGGVNSIGIGYRYLF